MTSLPSASAGETAGGGATIAAGAARNVYVFDKAVPMVIGDGTASTRFADLYKAGAFVHEAKQSGDTWIVILFR